MVYNSDADSQDIVSTVLDKAGATSITVYPLKRITRNFNSALDLYLGWAFEAQGEHSFDDINETSAPIDTQDLESGINEYKFSAFTETILNLIKLTVLNSDGTEIELIPERLENLTDAFLQIYKSSNTGTPDHYIKYGDFIYLRPYPDYSETKGLRAYFNRPASYLASTDTTKVPGVPVIHHPLLCDMTASQYKYDKDIITLNEKMAIDINAKSIVMDFFSNRSKDVKKVFKPRITLFR